MHAKAVLLGVLAAISAVLAEDAPNSVSAEATKTTKSYHQEPWETKEPAKASKYHADIKSLHASIKANPMYASMKDVLKTAIPQSYRDAMQTNPASLRSQYKSSPPPWYSSMPADVRSFMEDNQKAIQSIQSKDNVPHATGAHSAPGTSAAQGKDKKSEASGLGILGATIGTLAGAFGVALLLL